MTQAENLSRLSERLRDKVAIVTGSGHGIGQGSALMLARHGAAVLGCDLDDGAANATLARARSAGLPFASVSPCDLTRPADVAALVAAALQHFGRIDVLVNAAAWAAFAPVATMDYEREWRPTLQAELDTVFLLCQAAWPHLEASGRASIINFASANAHGVLQGSAAVAHCAGKGGVLAMTRQLAMEGAPHGIRANTISPGLVVTAATQPVLADPAFHARVLAKHMLNRLGQPEDIAWCVTYLASDESSWVTAADFCIDGGTTKW